MKLKDSVLAGALMLAAAGGTESHVHAEETQEVQNDQIKKKGLPERTIKELRRIFSPFAQKSLDELIILLDNDVFTLRDGAHKELEFRIHEEVQRTKKPLSWIEKLNPANAVSVEQRLSFRHLLAIAQEEYVAVVTDGTPFTPPEEWEHDPPSVAEFLQELSRQTGNKIDTLYLYTITEHPMQEIDPGTFWEVLQKAKTRDGHKIAANACIDGVLSTGKYENNDTKEAYDESVLAKLYHLSPGRLYGSIRIMPEPRFVLLEWDMHGVEAVSTRTGEKLDVPQGAYKTGRGNEFIPLDFPVAEQKGDTATITVRIEVEMRLLHPHNGWRNKPTSKVLEFTFEDVPLKEKEEEK